MQNCPSRFSASSAPLLLVLPHSLLLLLLILRHWVCVVYCISFAWTTRLQGKVVQSALITSEKLFGIQILAHPEQFQGRLCRASGDIGQVSSCPQTWLPLTTNQYTALTARPQSRPGARTRGVAGASRDIEKVSPCQQTSFTFVTDFSIAFTAPPGVSSQWVVLLPPSFVPSFL